MPKRSNSIKPVNNVSNSTNNNEQSSGLELVDIDNDDYQDAPRIRKSESTENNFQNYALNTLGLSDANIIEQHVEYAPERPKPFWNQTKQIPRWAILLISNAFIIFIITTFIVVFVNKNVKTNYGQSCLTNDNCFSNVGLRCTAGTCLCGGFEYWDNTRCISQRTFNRSCTSQNQCNSLMNLLCLNVTIGGYRDSLCLCSSLRYWKDGSCVALKTYNETCTANSECEFTKYLTCINGRCNCNTTQFWNFESCESRRTYGAQCFTDYWCNNASSSLLCSTWEPTSGTCDCLSGSYWWSGNNTCARQLPRNSPCTVSYQCMTNLSLSCSSSTNPTTCQCDSQYWYNTTKCTRKFPSGSTCTSSIQCDDTVLLSCNLTTQRCQCNNTMYIWDGSQCAPRRSIGGACLANNQCLAIQNLTCPTSGVWNSTCACPTNHFWDSTLSLCVLKKLWNQTCSTSYECYDGGFLSCQPSASLNATICDCGNFTQYWTGFLNNTYSGYCTPKIGYNVTSFTCVSSYQCQDYNYMSCISGQCGCTYLQYWDGTLCEPRLNYSYPCNSTTMCRNWPGGPNLQCLTPTGGSVQQCLCTSTQYFDYCADTCFTAKGWQQPCNTSSCYPVSMCDQSKSLTCVNNICNCTSTQWWNSTRCVSKGTYLASCVTGQHYQCEQYNYLSCVGSQCQCSTNMYWSTSLNYCVAKQSYGGSCQSTNECITAAGVGLSCISNTCQCSSGYVWQTSTQQCVASG